MSTSLSLKASVYDEELTVNQERHLEIQQKGQKRRIVVVCGCHPMDKRFMCSPVHTWPSHEAISVGPRINVGDAELLAI